MSRVRMACRGLESCQENYRVNGSVQVIMDSRFFESIVTRSFYLC